MDRFIPTRKTATTADTMELLSDRLIRYHAFPVVLISDKGPRFQPTLWQQLCHRFQMKSAMSSSYHPQTDGKTERVNRTLEQIMRAYILTEEREWELLLRARELACNITSHLPTERSPFEVMIGQNSLTAADPDIVGTLVLTLTPPITEAFRQLCDQAQSHIMKASTNKSRAPTPADGT
ncbi:Polyprotein, related [Eimeria brunetti]|uniref:Polyprotein, related n=1 Tax=Eimeria brunetti TaxID=51314 RepID=U6LEW5_9EIME|nr:Polyprotein, related [Eimeria brunetti]